MQVKTRNIIFMIIILTIPMIMIGSLMVLEEGVDATLVRVDEFRNSIYEKLTYPKNERIMVSISAQDHDQITNYATSRNQTKSKEGHVNNIDKPKSSLDVPAAAAGVSDVLASGPTSGSPLNSTDSDLATGKHDSKELPLIGPGNSTGDHLQNMVDLIEQSSNSSRSPTSTSADNSSTTANITSLPTELDLTNVTNVSTVSNSNVPSSSSNTSTESTANTTIKYSVWSYQSSSPRPCSESTLNSNFIPFNKERMEEWPKSSTKISDLQKEWKSSLSSTWSDEISTSISPSAPSPTALKRGVLYTASSKNIRMLMISIKILQTFTKDTPLSIQVWHDNDLNQVHITKLEKIDHVKVYNLDDFDKTDLKPIEDGRKYQIKGAALVYTDLDEILMLDSDNVVLQDPSFLFTTPAFVETGFVVWPDYWKTHPDNPIWQIMGLQCVDEYEQESGQMLVNKRFPGVQKVLLLSYFIQLHSSSTYADYILGDKDTFRFSLRALDQAYHMVHANPNPVSSFPFPNGEFSGHSMLQYAPFWGTEGTTPSDWKDPKNGYPVPLFMHCNLLKYGMTKKNFEQRFGKVQRFKNGMEKDAVFLMKGAEMSIQSPGMEEVEFEHLVPGFNDLFDQLELSKL